MSIWVAVPEKWIGVSKGILWTRVEDSKWETTETDDTRDTMTEYGWGLIAPATLSRWRS